MSANNRIRAIHLYRTILKFHRKNLPTELSEVGDRFVKFEFRANKKATPQHAEKFFQEWEQYLTVLQEQSLGADLVESEVDSIKLSKEHRDKLSELKDEIFRQT